MKKSTTLLVIIWQYLTMSLLVFGSAESTISYGQRIWLERALDGIEKALSFYKSHYSEVNLDSVYGLRVAEGSLGKATSALVASDNDREMNKFLTRIQEMQAGVKIISIKSMKHLKSRNAKYFEKFKAVIEKPWDYVMEFVNYNSSLVYSSSVATKEPDDGFDEEISDFCMTALMGTHKKGKRSRCEIPPKCWKKMVAKGTTGYYLTHQALFFLLAEVADCHKAILEKAGSEEKLNAMYTHFGSNIYNQAKELYESGIKADYKDLFMEHVVICSMFGIIQCHNIQWLDLILSWQDRSGCYKEPRFAEREKEQIAKMEAGHTVKVETEILESSDVAEQDRIARSAEKSQSGPMVMRKLLEEIELSNGCLAHMTGLATGLLGNYIRWLVEPPDYEKFGMYAPWIPQPGRTTISPQFHQSFLRSSNILFISFVLVLLFVITKRFCRTPAHFKRGVMKWL